MSKYNVGTVEVTNGDATVIGTGTAFNTNAATGDLFTLVGSATPYYVGSVTDATHLELAAPYAGSSASGQSYTIQTSETTNHGLPYEEDGDIEIATIRKAALVKIDALLAATLTAGAILFGSATGALAADDTNLHWDDTENYVRLAGTGTMAALSSGQMMLGGKTTTGATIRGYGSTYDVTIANRAGTTVLGIGPNTTAATFAGSVTGQAGSFTTLAASGQITTSFTTAGAAVVSFTNLSATGYGPLFRGGGGTTEYIAQWLRYDGTERMTLTNTGLSVTGTLAASGKAIFGTTSVLGYTQAAVSGTLTDSGSGGQAFRNDVTIASSAGNDAYGGIFINTINKAGSGTHADFVGVVVFAPTIGAGAATLTNATTLKIVGAPSTGTNQRAVWVTAGISQFDGGVNIGAISTNNLLDDASNGAGTATLYIGNASINVTSDERIKTNVRLWDGDASAILKALPVKAWDKYLSDAPQGGYEGGYVGFTAQDLHKVAPWSVNTQGDTGLPWQARYEFLNGIIVKGWQDHESQIQELLAFKAKAIPALAARGITLQ